MEPEIRFGCSRWGWFQRKWKALGFLHQSCPPSRRKRMWRIPSVWFSGTLLILFASCLSKENQVAIRAVSIFQSFLLSLRSSVSKRCFLSLRSPLFSSFFLPEQHKATQPQNRINFTPLSSPASKYPAPKRNASSFYHSASPYHRPSL